MSKTELLLSKFRNISTLVSIGSFVFFVIVLIIAVVSGAITCGDGQAFCSISPDDAVFKSSLWTLFVLMTVFMVTARVLDFILQRESKLVDVNEYRASLVKEKEVSFSQSKMYSDIIKMKKTKYTETPSDDDFEEDFEEDFKEDIVEEKTLEDLSVDAREKVRGAKLSFFDRKKLEQSLMEEERSASEEITEIDELEVKETFIDKVKAINWMFWVKDETADETEESKQTSIEKIKNINLIFWAKKPLEKEGETDSLEDEKQEPKLSFVEKLKNVNWVFWKGLKTTHFDDSFYEDDPQSGISDESVRTQGSKIAVVKEKSGIIGSKEIEKSVEEKTIYTRLNKGELIGIVAKTTSLTKAKSKLIINATLDIITEQVKNDDEVKIGKFGRFRRVFVKASDNIDPDTGKRIKIEEGYSVNFYPDKYFKDMFLDDIPVVKEEPIVEDIPVVKEEPIVEDIPIVKEEPIVEDIPVVKEEPIVKDIPVVKEEPKIQEEKKSVIKEEEIIDAKVDIPIVVKPQVKQKPKKVTKTKADFIKLISESGEISKNKANKFLGTFAKVIIEQLAKGQDIELEGLGTITTILMPSKEAVNPQTKQKIVVPAHRQVRMRFSEEYKDSFE